MRSVDPYTLASYFHAAGRSDEAVKAIRLSLRNDLPEDDAWAYNLWGAVRWENKHYADAERLFKAATAVSSQFSIAYENWGSMLVEQRRYEEAGEKFQRMPKGKELYRRLADLYHTRGRESAKTGGANSPHRAEDPAEESRKRAGESFRMAKHLYERALAIDPGYVAARIGLAELHHDMGDDDAADKELSKVILTEPNLALAYSQVAATLVSH